MVEKIRKEARRRRAPLREAAWLLEAAIAAPAATGTQWRERMQKAEMPERLIMRLEHGW